MHSLTDIIILTAELTVLAVVLSKFNSGKKKKSVMGIGLSLGSISRNCFLNEEYIAILSFIYLNLKWLCSNRKS